MTFLNKNASLNSSCIDILQYQFKKELWNKPVTKINSFPFSLIKNIVILTSYNTNNICKHFLQQIKPKIKIKNGINRSKEESMKCLQKAEGSERISFTAGSVEKKPLTGKLHYECNKHWKSLYQLHTIHLEAFSTAFWAIEGHRKEKDNERMEISC